MSHQEEALAKSTRNNLIMTYFLHTNARLLYRAEAECVALKAQGDPNNTSTHMPRGPLTAIHRDFENLIKSLKDALNET